MIRKQEYQPRRATTKINAPPAFDEQISCQAGFESSRVCQGAHLLQLQCIIKIPLAHFPVCSGQHERCGRHQAKYSSEDDVDFQREEEECEESKPPHQQVQSNGRVESRCRGPCWVSICGVWGTELESRQLEHAEGKPEDVEERHDHHGKEVAHNPFEYHGECQEDGPGEEEYSAVGSV